MSEAGVKAAGKAEKVNVLGLDRKAYEGKPSTLCGGCGHDSVTRALITAYYESGVEPWRVAKVSGIGCSSKTITYFLEKSHGFNGVHGRMPALATGANIANRSLQVVGVSGDGDTASIGMGQFIHAVRRNLDMLYVLENNGVYGLTKGQFSATAAYKMKAKKAGENPYPEIDCAALAIELGCGFVARSFSANQKQMTEIFKAAIAYRGFSFIDVISPCVTFNPDMPGSSKTYVWAKEHQIELNEIGFMPDNEDLPEVEMGQGEVKDVPFANGATLRLRTLEAGFDATDKDAATHRLHKAIRQNEMLTGILYVDETKKPLVDLLGITEQPLWNLPESVTRPSKQVFDEILKDLR